MRRFRHGRDERRLAMFDKMLAERLQPAARVGVQDMHMRFV